MVDISTNLIKSEYIATQSRHLLNWSCNLFGVYNETHIPLKILDSKLNSEWDYISEVEIPIFKIDFIVDDDFGYYYVDVFSLLKNLKVPYEYGNSLGLKATPIADHCPTWCNYWHFEIRWKDDNGNLIDPNQKQKWTDRIASWLKSHIHEYCLIDKPDKIKIFAFT